MRPVRKRYVSTAGAGRILGLSTVAVWYKAKAGLIPVAAYVGKEALFDPEELRRFKRQTEAERRRPRKAV